LIHCPECGGNIDIDPDEVEEGEEFPCPECDVDLEVVSKSPLELQVLDLDDDDEEEDEEASEEDEEDDVDDETDESDNGFY